MLRAEVIRMKRSFVIAFVTMFLSGTMLVYSQQQQRSPSQQQRDRSTPSQQDTQQQKVTLTGCLAKDGNAGRYAVTDRATHEKVSFPGPSQLDKYVDQMVQVNGTMLVRDNGDKEFHPESIASIATTCTASAFGSLYRGEPRFALLGGGSRLYLYDMRRTP